MLHYDQQKIHGKILIFIIQTRLNKTYKIRKKIEKFSNFIVSVQY